MTVYASHEIISRLIADIAIAHKHHRSMTLVNIMRRVTLFHSNVASETTALLKQFAHLQ